MYTTEASRRRWMAACARCGRQSTLATMTQRTCRLVSRRRLPIAPDWACAHCCRSCADNAGFYRRAALHCTAEWHQWLHKTRDAPPTEQDLAAGAAAREALQARVQRREAEEAMRRQQEAATGGTRSPPIKPLGGGDGGEW